MNKSDLVAKLAAENPHLKARDVDRAVSAVLHRIASALSNGDRVELRGFGVFSVRPRPARLGRNPRNGEPVEVAAKKAPFFKPSTGLHRRLNLTSAEE